MLTVQNPHLGHSDIERQDTQRKPGTAELENLGYEEAGEKNYVEEKTIKTYFGKIL